MSKSIDMLVVGKTKTFDKLKNDTIYYLQLSNDREIIVSKEEFYVNSVGMKLKLESKVAYK